MKVSKLICVSENNNNKYYFLFEQADGTFNVEYGRVDSTKQTTSYSMSQWDKKYREKINKGYKDITELYAIEDDSDNSTSSKIDESFISNDLFVKTLIEDLQRWATNTVKANYKVSTKSVTQKMVDEAQNIVNQIATVYSTQYTTTELNELLLKLFTIIPRKMGNVKDYLVKENDSNDRIKRIIDEEQSLLDTMAGQVSMQEVKPILTEDKSDEKINGLLDSMGVSVEHITDANEIAKIKKLMGDSSNLFSKAFKVVNYNTEKRYNSIKIENEELLWHGSRNQNYISLLQHGLLIRPSGVATNGAMFGSGGYLANKSRKSIGYTSLSGSYWTNGNSGTAYLLLFAANLGNQRHVYKHTSECYDFNQKTIAPYDSVFAHGGADMLRNDEIIIYSENRSTMRYLIEIKS